MLKKYFVIIFILCCSQGSAQNYLNAKSAIIAGAELQSYQHLKKQPLYPYLAGVFYQQNPQRLDEAVELFKDYFNAPPIKKLLNQWARQQYEKGNYQSLVQHYYDTGDVPVNCLYREAQLKLGNTRAAFDKIENIWFSSQSISPQCDAVFAQWQPAKQAGLLKKRAVLLYLSGDSQRAKAMVAQLNDSESNTIKRFANLLEYPEMIETTPTAQLVKTPLERKLLPKILYKLIQIDASRYASLIIRLVKKNLNDRAFQAVLSRLTSVLSGRQNTQAKKAYAVNPKPSKRAMEDLLHYLIKNEDWRAIEQLIKPNEQRAMGLYWLARAMEKNGKNARSIYRQLAKKRSYYGFLAADKLGYAYRFEAKPIRAAYRVQNDFKQNANLQRGKALYQYGESTLARREMLPLAKKMSRERQRQLAYWLSHNGFHHDAIYVLGKLRDWDDIYTRFPTPFKQQVRTASQLTHVGLPWIYAIMRQESSMNPLAISRAKAKGLMQLIPSTANLMAKDLGIPLYGQEIFNPEINIKLGANYLAEMYQRFGNKALSAAAYNAGPHRVEKWLANDTDDMTIWVEKIPFRETRKYVKHVLEYQQVYAKHLKLKIPRLTTILTENVSP